MQSPKYFTFIYRQYGYGVWRDFNSCVAKTEWSDNVNIVAETPVAQRVIQSMELHVHAVTGRLSLKEDLHFPLDDRHVICLFVE